MKFYDSFDQHSNFHFQWKTLLTILLVFSMCYCDLPIHCKRESIDGEWVFRINKEIFDPSLKKEETTCGHGFPDKIESTVGDHDFSFENYRDVKIKLHSDYKVYQNNELVGSWTPIYDEGFIVKYKSSVFTAFMKYYKKYSSETIYVSNCDKTMIGWYIADEKKNNKSWSCFFGFKASLAANFRKKINFLSKKEMTRYGEESAKNNSKLSLNLPSSIKEAVGPKEGQASQPKILQKGKNILKNFVKKESSNQQTFIPTISMFDFLSLEENMELNSTSSLGTSLNNDLSILEMERIKYEDQAEIVNEINSMGLSWKAEVHNGFKGLSLLELSLKLGLKSKSRSASSFNFSKTNPTLTPSKLAKSNLLVEHEKALHHDDRSLFSHIDFHNDNHFEFKKEEEESPSPDREADSPSIKDEKEIQKYLNTEINNIDEKVLSKNWDWRNVGGESYVSKLRKQGACGSCYIFSAVGSLEARLRVLTNNKDKTEFSRQFPLSCSFYTEGCEGGYPLLVGKFFNEFEIVPDECFEYEAKNIPCSQVCDYSRYPKKYSVSKYEYLGGFYGATSEIEMMKELRARGPIPGNIEVPWSFTYYSNGIYSHEKVLKKNAGKISKTTLFDKKISWEKVDHSILLIGWGEENGVKYWIGMNTWGEEWGENGYFRILRGENESSIESMGDTFRIKVQDR